MLLVNMAEAQVISLFDLLEHTGVSEQQLNNRISDNSLRQISLFLTPWRKLAPFLDIDEADVEVIETEGRGEEGKRLKMLQRWKNKNAFRATYRKLIDTLLSLGMAGDAEKLCRLLQPAVTSAEPPASETQVEITKKNQMQMKGRFVNLQILVCEKLQSMQINMWKFHYFVKGLFQCSDCIPASEKIDEIFQALTHHHLWDFLNFSPLHEIAKKFGWNDKDIKRGFEDYLHELASYRAVTKLADYIAYRSQFPDEAYDDSDLSKITKNDQRYFTKLTMKLDENIKVKSLDYIIELWDSLSVYLRLPSLTYLLDEIHEGCVSVTWLVPPIAMSAIIRRVDDPETATSFSKLKIIRMETDNLCLFEVQEETTLELTQEKDSSFTVEQFPDSREQVQKEASQDIFNETVEQEQDSLSQKLPQHGVVDAVDDNWKLQDLWIEIVRFQEEIWKRKEKENDDLRISIANNEVEIEQLREKVTMLEHELQELQQTAKSPIELREKALVQDSSMSETGSQEIDVHGLSVQQTVTLSQASSQSFTELSTRTRLQWRRGADAPEEITEAQAVVIEERVYVRGWSRVYQYDCWRDTWNILPDCPVYEFGMAQFLGNLITVGGLESLDMSWLSSSVTGKVYQFSAQHWEEFLPPMPTARHDLTVVTRTSSSSRPPAIAACGGHDGNQTVNTVEVFLHTSSQWHTAKPLPIPCSNMTSVTINDTSYILGGWDKTFSDTKCCFSVSLDSLVENITSPHSQLDDPLWVPVSDTPMTRSIAAKLRGSLIAIGGYDTSTDTDSAAIYFLTSDGSWERVREGDLPELRQRSAVYLPSGELLAAGGYSCSEWKREVFIASIVD